MSFLNVHNEFGKVTRPFFKEFSDTIAPSLSGLMANFSVLKKSGKSRDLLEAEINKAKLSIVVQKEAQSTIGKFLYGPPTTINLPCLQGPLSMLASQHQIVFFL